MTNCAGAVLVMAFSLFAVGCAHTARHFDAPDSTKLQAESRKLSAAVVASREAVKVASAAVADTKTSHDAERAETEAIAPKLDALLLQAPEALKPEIQALQADLEALRASQSFTDTKLADAQAAQATATGKLEEATAAKNEVEKLGPAYISDVGSLAETANASEQGWAKDSKSLQWYRLHFWLSWIIAGLGVAACGLVAFLKFTGRLSLSAASIAAKL